MVRVVILEEELIAIGIPVPDSSFSRTARELIATVAPPFLVNHSVRSYAWAVELARHDSLPFDQEILWVSAMLHDIGLVPAYDLGGCYERDGAIEAERFSLEHLQPPERARAIFDVVDLHQLDETPPGSTNEVVLLNHSTGTDVTGYRYDHVRPEAIGPVLAAYPRLEFKRDFAAAFRDQADRKPTCIAVEMIRTGLLAEIASAPFDS
jgi:HD domain